MRSKRGKVLLHLLQVDTAIYYDGKSYLVKIDDFSRWIEVFCITSNNSTTIIAEFKKILART